MQLPAIHHLNDPTLMCLQARPGAMAREFPAVTSIAMVSVRRSDIKAAVVAHVDAPAQGVCSSHGRDCLGFHRAVVRRYMLTSGGATGFYKMLVGHRRRLLREKPHFQGPRKCRNY